MSAYWPWMIGLGILIVYELWAIVVREPTLSQMVWRAQRRWPPLRWIVGVVLLALFDHFVTRWVL